MVVEKVTMKHPPWYPWEYCNSPNGLPRWTFLNNCCPLLSTIISDGTKMSCCFNSLLNDYWKIIEWFFCASEALETNEIQLNKYKTDPYFLQIFQSNMLVCLIISMLCKSCEPICAPEISPVLYHLENQNKNNFKFSVQFTNLTKHGYKHCRALEILKKIRIFLAFI